MDPATARGLDGFIALTMVELVALALLALALAGNAVQLYRARMRSRTLHHALLGLFKSIGWLQARELELLRQVRGRAHALDVGDGKGPLQEFAAHLGHSHYALRLLHEQLVAAAKGVSDTDPHWAGDRFGYVDDEVEAFLGRSRAW